MAALVAKAQRGDSPAFAELYRTHFPRVLRQLELRVSNRDDALDLTQQVFVRLLERLPQYRPEDGAFSAWLFTIVHNLATDRARHDRRTDVMDPAAMAQLQETRLERDDHTREAPDTGVAGLIERLPHKQRRVLLLTYGWGYGATEIAEILGTSADAVRHLRHRTLRTLTPRLAHLR